MLKTFKHPKYTYTKNGIYYFSIAIPSDFEHHYSKKRINQSLRTKSRERAKQSAQLLAGRLYDYWFHLRLQNANPPLAELLKPSNQTGAIAIDEALKLYLDVKGIGRPKRFRDTATRNINYLKQFVGNKSLSDYSLSDASKLRDSLLREGLSAPSLHRIFSGIKAVFNFAVSENWFRC